MNDRDLQVMTTQLSQDIWCSTSSRVSLIGSDDLDVPRPATPPPPAPPAVRGTFREARALALGDFERHYLKALLAETGGNITQAARVSGKGRRTIGRLVQKHQLKEGA